ncbi:hypothetical protein SNE40_016106 [Patella caerulea]|uniref:G-protein coupled receptors family 1 profile domain-containing protein n=2 Tax=Patella caerulea TaxID=87958 RepID=A0AAN8PI81_PATCE
MYDKTDGDWSVVEVVLLISMGLFCLIALSANLLVITTILVTRKLRSVSSIFVVNMAFCDLGVSLVSMPLVLSALFNGGWIYSQMACSITGCIFTVFAVGSILSVAIVSLDRFFAIIYCLQYSTWKTLHYGGGVLLCLWIQALLFGLSPLVGWSEVSFDKLRYMCLIRWDVSPSYAILNCVICFCIPLIIMTICYVKIIQVAHQHVRQIEDTNHHIQRHSPESSHISLNGAVAAAAMFSVRRLSMLSFPGSVEEITTAIDVDFNSGASTTTTASPFRRDVRTIVRLLGLIVGYGLCWSPYVYVNIAQIFNQNIPSYMLTLSTWFALMNSCINPFSYAISSKRFRFATKKLFNYNDRHKFNVTNPSHANNQSSYSAFLKTLRSPSVSSDPGDSRRLMRMRSMDRAIRNVTELRPSSASAPDIKKVKMSSQYLQVPQQKIPFSGSTEMPLQYREPDILPLKDRNPLGSGTRRNTSPEAIGQNNNVLEDFVFSKNNKAKIKIKFDLVPN